MVPRLNKCRSTISLSKTHEMWHNHTFSQRNKATKTAGGMWREGEGAEKNGKKDGGISNVGASS